LFSVVCVSSFSPFYLYLYVGSPEAFISAQTCRAATKLFVKASAALKEVTAVKGASAQRTNLAKLIAHSQQMLLDLFADIAKELLNDLQGVVEMANKYTRDELITSLPDDIAVEADVPADTQSAYIAACVSHAGKGLYFSVHLALASVDINKQTLANIAALVEVGAPLHDKQVWDTVFSSVTFFNTVLEVDKSAQCSRPSLKLAGSRLGVLTSIQALFRPLQKGENRATLCEKALNSFVKKHGYINPPNGFMKMLAGHSAMVQVS
jgi:hypothetical protein